MYWPIVSLVGPNYQLQLLPTLSSIILGFLSGGRVAGEGGQLAGELVGLEFAPQGLGGKQVTMGGGGTSVE